MHKLQVKKCLVTAGALLCFLVQLQCTISYIGLFLYYRLVISTNVQISYPSNFRAEFEEQKRHDDETNTWAIL